MDNGRRTGEHLAALVAAAVALSACQTIPLANSDTSESATVRVAARAAQGGDYETAATLYRRAYDTNPKSVEALVGLGRSYAGLGQNVRAEHALAQAAVRSPRDPKVLLELARVQIAAGRPEAALTHLQQAASRAPRDLEVITAQAIALDALNRHTEAQSIYRHGLALDPTNFALLSNLGLSLGLSGQAEQGIPILRELVRDREASAQTRGNLALLYGVSGREREARALLAPDLGAAEIDENISYYRELKRHLPARTTAAATP
jgi:Flp pilus assembly protein TadD